MNFIDLTYSKEPNIKITTPGETILFFYNVSREVVIDLEVESAEVKIYGVYVGTRDDSFRLGTTQRHAVGSTVSDVLVKGAFKDQSCFEYEGLIRIEKGAQKSNAYQKNQNLIMSEEVSVISRPFLEILANDIFCTHGATTGRINKEHVYYLQTRGIEKQKAESVLSEGFITEVFQKLEANGIIKEVEAYKKDALTKIHA